MGRGAIGTSATRRTAVAALAGVVGLVGAGSLVACTSGSGDRAAPDTTVGRRRSSSTTVAPTSSSTTIAPSSTTIAFDLRRADLGAARYRVRCVGGEVELQPGVAAPGIDDRPVVLDPLAPQFVDLTGDGRPEAVAEAACRVVDDPDPEAAVRSVVVLAADAGSVVQMGQPLEGDDPTVVGASIAVGREASVGTGADGRSRSMVYEPFTFDGTSWVPGSDGVPVQASDPVTVDGIGSLVVGAPFGELAIATGQPIEAAERADAAGACVDVVVPGGPEGVGAVGGEGVVRAVEVETPAVRTDEGLGVGSTEVEVQFTFPGFVTVRPAGSGGGGRQLVVASPDLGDRVLRFDTDGTVVTAYAAGEAGWADGAGGCG